MATLPWLLDWPPRLSVLVITVGSVTGLLLFGGGIDTVTSEEASIDAAPLSVSLTDEHSYPDAANGSVQTCFASGPPGDCISVNGEVNLTVPATDESLLLAVGLTSDEWTHRVSRAGAVSVDGLWRFEDNRALKVGNPIVAEIRLRDGGTSVANRTTTVVVENASRSYDC